jgi:YHS domain-containing protein
VNNLMNLLDRINAETVRQEERKTRLQQECMAAFESRRRRYRELFQPAVKRLKTIWLPRLQLLGEKFRALAEKFGETVTVSPEIESGQDVEHSGSVVFTCDSPPAKIQVKFGFFHDFEVRNLTIEYELKIIPVFLKFEPHSRLEQKVESFDDDEVVQWLDDRIVDFVRTYLAIHEHSTYVADQLVEDPIAQMRFPKYAANSTLQREGITYYFISPETQREFQTGPPVKLTGSACKRR